MHPILRTTHVQIILKRLPTKGKSRPACRFKSCALHLHFPLINYNTTHCWTTHCAQYHDRPTILHQWEMPALLTYLPEIHQPHHSHANLTSICPRTNFSSLSVIRARLWINPFSSGSVARRNPKMNLPKCDLLFNSSKYIVFQKYSLVCTVKETCLAPTCKLRNWLSV